MIHIAIKVPNIDKNDLETIKKYAKQGDKFTVFETADRGIYSVMNRSIKIGEFKLDGTIISDTNDTILDLLSEVSNNK